MRVAAIGDAHLGRSYYPVTTAEGVNQRERDGLHCRRDPHQQRDYLVGRRPGSRANDVDAAARYQCGRQSPDRRRP